MQQIPALGTWWKQFMTSAECAPLSALGEASTGEGLLAGMEAGGVEEE